ncbi:MAG TPA: helix-turn-helix domain-containing protein [Verrucomicrobiae bacterium]|nr:helix-turn-helix domain-containing protein [Verrucomicrobiae bacterium]
MIPKTVGLIVFEQMAADELTGPAEAFSRAKMPTGDGRELPCYRVLTLGIGTARCVTKCGIIVKPQLEMKDAPPLDTLIVPGGSGIHNARSNKKIARWLGRQALVTRRIATLGTGIYALAATGLLDRREVTAHWRFAKDVALRFPKLRVTPDRLFVKDGQFYTCAGGASAVDLSLSLIEEDYGRQVALTLARELVVHVKRSGEQEQYSEPLQFQVESSERFADLAAWILCNLNQDLSVEALAQRACMSPRNFARVFKHVFGTTPAEFVATARVREAQRRLRVRRNSIDSVGASVGFKSADAFSRAFEQHVGCRPSTYRALLGVTAEEDFLKQRSRDVEPVLAHA